MRIISFLRDQRTGSVDSLSAVITILGLILAAWAAFKLLDWGIVNAVFSADAEACHQASGACWGFVAEKWRLILFGRFPYEEQWRPAVGTTAVLLMLTATAFPAFWNRTGARLLAAGWGAALLMFFALMHGGVLGLEPVDSDSWGGLPLTVMLTLIGMSASAPLGILLALGRHSELPLVRALATAYIPSLCEACPSSRCCLLRRLSFRFFCHQESSSPLFGEWPPALFFSRPPIWRRQCEVACRPFQAGRWRQRNPWDCRASKRTGMYCCRRP